MFLVNNKRALQKRLKYYYTITFLLNVQVTCLNKNKVCLMYLDYAFHTSSVNNNPPYLNDLEDSSWKKNDQNL